MPLLLYAAQDGQLVSYTSRGSSPPPSRLLVGAYVGHPDSSTASFAAANDAYGPLVIRRQFNANIPASFSASSSGPDVGKAWTSFLSVKADPAEIIAGTWDDEITNLAATGPTDRPWWLTCWHEPENDVPAFQPAPKNPAFPGGAQQFVTMFKHFYELVKAANPVVRCGPVHLGSAWKSGAPVTGGAGSVRYEATDWIVPPDHADFYGVDTYNSKTTTGRNTLATAENFQRWFAYFQGLGRPLTIPEFGRVVNPDDPTARPREIAASVAWAQGTGKFDLIMYWDADDPNTGAWSLDELGRDAWRAAAESGRALA
ncbi:hypothetical protein AB0K34_04850 [Actinomadura sp. NPDC049382]|uniref:hypothetical protein n=1 Tax=Actinomadura sp. NPDC049382 TaxID=3158220 RepID=UPI003439AEEB